jgi:hypothetical protein
MYGFKNWTFSLMSLRLLLEPRDRSLKAEKNYIIWRFRKKEKLVWQFLVIKTWFLFQIN